VWVCGEELDMVYLEKNIGNLESHWDCVGYERVTKGGARGAGGNS
jgi:hypothetical protein